MNWAGRDRGQRRRSKPQGRNRASPHLLRPRVEQLEDRRLLSAGPFPVPLLAVDPLGGLIYQSSINGDIAAPGQTDRFTVDLDGIQPDGGQTVAVVVDPQASLQPTIELFDPGNVSMGRALAGRRGKDALLQAVSTDGAGTYTVAVGGHSGSTGGYSVELIVNALVEPEWHHGPTNDERASADDLGPTFISLGSISQGSGSAQRAAVVGMLPEVPDVAAAREKFDADTLSDEWTTSSSQPEGRIRLTGQFGAVSSPYSLVMDRDPRGRYNLNQAIWAKDLSGLRDVRLRFFHAEWGDQTHGFQGDFVGSFNADGVAISDDGVTWHPVWDAPDQTDGEWRSHTVDLSAQAARAGMTLGPDFRIKFQQYDDGPPGEGGRGFDEIVIVAPAPAEEDWYRFTLDDGQSVTLAVTTPRPVDVSVDLWDADGNLLAAGAASPHAQRVINQYIDATADGTAATCFARVAGVSITDYSLVVTRGADFEVEPDYGPPPAAQDLTLAKTVLGYAGLKQPAGPQKLTAFEPQEHTSFGRSVAVSGDTAIVGTYAGHAAYVFRREGNRWKAWQELTASDNGAGFGGPVAIGKETIIVGAPWAHDGGEPVGAAYVFFLDGDRWVEQQRIIASDAAERREFGRSVALSGNTAILGASDEDHVGAVYLFRFDGSQWVEQQRLTAADADQGDYFGRSVSLSGDTAVVGAHGDDDHGAGSGSAYVFKFDGGQWTPQQKLTATDTERGDQFGYSVAVSGDVVVVGVPQDDDLGGGAGAAYGFQFDGNRWIETQKLAAVDGAPGDHFGASVSIDGNQTIVGAWGDDKDRIYSGAAYPFQFGGGRWHPQQKLVAPDRDPRSQFGRTTALDGSTIIVGADGERSYTGAAYLFDLTLVDDYALGVQSGDELIISTITPGDGPLQFVNTLDPAVELYDPGGTLVAADDNGAPDGRNALLTHTAAATGAYTIRVLGAHQTQGEYVLSVTGQTGTPAPFEAAAADPADGTHLPAAPRRITVDFNDPFLPGSVDASDLTIDGLPATAVSTFDANTLVFHLPIVKGDGPLMVSIPPGAILDLQRTPLEPFSATLWIDTTPPRVIASSLLEGDVAPFGTLVYTARFDEELEAAALEPDDVRLVGAVSGSHAPTVMDYQFDPVGLDSTLTLQFADLAEDTYTLTLYGGDGAFEDLLGHDLDGEPDPLATVPSGDGTAGGNFVVNFSMDISDLPFPVPLQAAAPAASLVYQSEARAGILAPDDTDRLTIDLGGRQMITVIVDPAATLQPTVELLDPHGTSIGGATAGAAGEELLLQAVAAPDPGVYTVVVGGTAGTTGRCVTEIILNAGVELEEHGGPGNDDRASAQDLDGTFLALPGDTGQRGAVLGKGQSAADDWYRFTMADGETATVALTTTPVRIVSERQDLKLQLYDQTGNPLAAGADAANLDRVISRFADTTRDGGPDWYFLRVTGSSGYDYSLVALRNADLDTEPNDAPAEPRDMQAVETVLGYAGHGTPATQTEWHKLRTLNVSGGRSGVTLSGRTAMVGRTWGGHGAGSVYVFQFDQGRWGQRQELVASDGDSGDQFGSSVSLSGDTALIGAPSDEDEGLDAGAAYVFHLDGDRWVEQQRLVPSDGHDSARFGGCVSISGDTAVIGASGDGHAGNSSGSAYVFQFDGARWVERQKLTASDTDAGDHFGISLAVDGQNVIIGAQGNDDHGSYTGSAYIFSFDGQQWSQQQKLLPADSHGGQNFGSSVSIAGDRAIVGAPGDEQDGYLGGSAYIFRLDDGQWVQQQKIGPSDGSPNDTFGTAVAIRGDTALIGDQQDDSEVGSAYLFQDDGSRWLERRKLRASDAAAGSRFGYSVCLDDTMMIVGSERAYGAYVFTTAWHLDDYAVAAQAGDLLTIRTATPGGGPGVFDNRLDPAVELYAPDGTLVAADDNGAPDGRNVQLVHPVETTGTYVLRLLPVGGSHGEYVLSVSGHTGAAPRFEVADTDPPDGGRIVSREEQLTVHFNDGLLWSSLDGSDLTIDGVPAQALTVIDGNTVDFALPPGLPDGLRTAAIAAGAIVDLQRTPLEPLSLSFDLDTTAPRVVESSLLEGEVVPDGRLVYTARFDRELMAANLRPWHVQLWGRVSDVQAPVGFSYDPASSRLTIEFVDLPEDRYTLMLPIGSGRFEDLVGHSLDGEPHPTTTIPSGDGRPGGSFVVHFTADSRADDAQPFRRLAPSGSLMSVSRGNTRRLGLAGDWHEFAFPAQAGEIISAAVFPDQPAAVMLIGLPGLAGPVAAPAPGQPAILPPTAIGADGTYAVQISADTVGTYRLQIGKNLAAEIVDTDTGSELSIDDAHLALGSGRYAVLGRYDTEHVELITNGGFETGDFTGWTAATNGLPELTPWTVSEAGGGFFFNSLPIEGVYSAYNGFDGQAGLLYELYQDVAIPADVLDAELTTNHRIVHSGRGRYPRRMEISIRDTDNRLLQILYSEGISWGGWPPTDLGWKSRTFDLSAYAGQTVRVHFAETIEETFAGPAMIEFDDISLMVAEATLEQPEVDAYSVDLTGKAGRQIDVILTGQDGVDFSGQRLELLDVDSSTVLATAAADPLGVPAENFDLAILGFTVPADGTYGLRLNSSAGGEYSILVTDSMVFDCEPNGGVADPRRPLRSLDDTSAALGYLGSSDRDCYRLTLDAGRTTLVLTDTPLDNPPITPGNTLDPRLSVLDAAGAEIAVDADSAPDGRNARVSFVPPQSGTYYVIVETQSNQGEYLLKVNPTAQVVGRHVFYNNSAFDGNDPAAGAEDDNALASDKQALLPGQTATFANYTGYSRGINGIMIHLAGLVGRPTVDDFLFRVGNHDDPTAWSDAPAPSSVTVRAGQGAAGSDRVTIVFNDNAITGQWLQVTMLPGENTGLAQPDVFYFGNAVGETGNSTTDAKVTVGDMLAARDNQRSFLDPAPIDFPFDFDRNARVGAVDMLIARNNTTHFLNALRLITVPGGKAVSEKASPVASRVSTHDTVFDLGLVQELRLQQILAGKLRWLHELEQPGAKERTSSEDNPSGQAVEILPAFF